MKLNKRIITGVGCGILAVVILVSVAGVRKKAAAQREVQQKMALESAPRPVQFERVKAVSLEKTRRYPGVVNASEQSALSFRVRGPLIEVNVKLGEPVKKGDLLMQIDPRDFKDRIQSLEARLAGASALQQNAQQDYARISKLFGENVLPQLDYDHAKNAQASADAALKNIHAQLVIERHALSDTSLRAPYDGVVTAQLAENREMVKSGDDVLQFHNIQTLEVTVSVPENEIVSRALDEALMVQVSFPSVPGRTFDSRLKEWSSVADPLTHTYAVTFEFQAPEDLKILPGMTGDISWRSPRQSTVLTVPVSALSPQADGSTFVWVFNSSDHAEPRCVTVGDLIDSSRVVIAEGLSEGEQVVVSGGRLIYKNLLLKTANNL